jgi:hypothetical protein
MMEKPDAMRKLIFTGMILLCAFTNNYAQTEDVKTAEDLWGNRIGFDSLIHTSGNTVIQPFSPSNCGYCMMDGWFIEKNYFENNRLKGGVNFTQCLFNPQLDIYAFTRHYRDTLTPVLTYPPELHQYHQDGFPVILAFRDGRQVIKLPEGLLAPYDSSFEQLKMTLWNDTSIRFTPVSDLHFATRIIYENMNYSAICVLADGNKTGFDANNEFAARARCYQVKYLSQLTNEDLERDIIFEGRFNHDICKYIAAGNSPFRIVGDSVLCIGDYRLGMDTIGICACIPNPMVPSKYMVVNIRGMKVKKGFFDNSVDFTIYRFDSIANVAKVLVHGFFDKSSGDAWSFSDSLCISNLAQGKNCIRTCKLPETRFLPEHDVTFAKPGYKRTKEGEEFTYGNGSCRFPAITADDKGTAWVCWEENGDILLSSVDRKNPTRIAVEHDKSYSYNPLVTFAGGKLWVFYLNDRDGFYRLYARCAEGSALSEPVLCSEILPCDAVTPSVVSTPDGIVVAWTYWKSNFRFPFYRVIKNGVPGEVHGIAVAKSRFIEGYTNAWFTRLAVGPDGKAWGAWNQHYPAILGVCSGNLAEEAISVTRITDNMDDGEYGGYPCPVNDGKGRGWVFWESCPWDVLEGGTQKICYSTCDSDTGIWAASMPLPMPANVYMNQTPGAALLSDGRIMVVWSGRTKNDDWALYYSCRENDLWSAPVKLTTGNEPARSPGIVADRESGAWITCHNGVGKNMKVKVIRIPRP